jgi:lipoate-protein ligase B
MQYWDGIIACGISEPIVSLADLLASAPNMQRVKSEMSKAFLGIFNI